MFDSSGSRWRKWDLHVHTPLSLFHRYTGSNDDAWEQFLQDLEALPPDFKVIGVNDYIFIDGFKKLKEERRKNRLKNIDLILPVIELRLDKFGGSDSHLSKVNFHIIFSEEVDPSLIEKQFLNALWTKYELAPSHAQLKKTWKAVPTKDSLEELGKLIIESVPSEQRGKFGGPMKEGFSNLTFTKDVIAEALDKPYFQDKYLFAVGKTEWADIKWNDHSIADKKNIINAVNVVFTAAASAEDCEKGRKKLREGCVNHHLLDCSDAHSFSSTDEKDRIGNCFTWVKSDTTFRGLKHALFEFDDRVFVGDEPPKLKEVRQNKTQYIKSVTFRKLAGSTLDEVWFDGDVPLNHGLVAIIGNKGSGKSALADTIGLLGNTHQDRSFSFLNERRFRDPRENKAKHFEALLTWESGKGKFKGLDASVSPQEFELVKYIPQNFLEQICNETEVRTETDFDKELKKVIFSHVSKADQLGQDSLDSLLSYKTVESFELIDALRAELGLINARIADSEDRLGPEYKQQIENSLQTKLAELAANESVKPDPEEPPPADPLLQAATAELISAINTAKDSRRTLLENIQSAEDRRTEDNRLIALTDKVLTRIGNFRRSFDTLKKETAADLAILGIGFDSLMSLTVNTAHLVEKKAALTESKSSADALLDPSANGSLPQKLKAVDEEMSELQSRLDAPSKRYEVYLRELEEWTTKQDAIKGNEQTPGTLIYFKNILDEIAKLPETLEELIQSRTDKLNEIFEKISALANTYRELYGAVEQFIKSHPVAKEILQLNFHVSVEDTGFEDRFFDQVSRAAAGSFLGTEEGSRVLRNILKKYNFNDWDNVKRFTEEIVNHLQYDRRSTQESPVRIGDQLRKGYTAVTLYDYIFSLTYLQPRYTLKLGEKELAQLSPGEKGALLLIFYLLVDRGQIPLIIDQPEENLDNQTMFDLLVPCLREAKKKRQVIIVTHNPNLAVVADAEQVIHAHLDKSDKNRMTYTSGAIENPEINKKVLDVLEGTRPAFDNRAQKYQQEKP